MLTWPYPSALPHTLTHLRGAPSNQRPSAHVAERLLLCPPRPACPTRRPPLAPPPSGPLGHLSPLDGSLGAHLTVCQLSTGCAPLAAPASAHQSPPAGEAAMEEGEAGPGATTSLDHTAAAAPPPHDEAAAPGCSAAPQLRFPHLHTLGLALPDAVEDPGGASVAGPSHQQQEGGLAAAKGAMTEEGAAAVEAEGWRRLLLHGELPSLQSLALHTGGQVVALPARALARHGRTLGALAVTGAGLALLPELHEEDEALRGVASAPARRERGR